MPRVAFFAEPTAAAKQRLALLSTLGYESTGLLQRNNLVHELQLNAPDQVIFHVPTAQALLIDDSVTTWLPQASALHPVTLWLEQAPTPEALAQVLECGVNEVVLGEVFGAALRMALQLAQARWQHQAAEREKFKLTQAASRAQAQAHLQIQLTERKWVERAKGVLMNAQGLGEDEAFRLLRGTAMHAKMQMAEVSRSVIEAAQWAEAMNRSGQLRMLSQRIVKLAAQRHVKVQARRAQEMQGDALKRTEANLAFLVALHSNNATAQSPLAQAIALPLTQVQAAWAALQSALGAPIRSTTPQALAGADQRAEELLHASEALTEALQATGGRGGLNVVNLCGRQRMRVQRLAKEALLASLLPERTEAAARLVQTTQDFEHTLHELEVAPLSSAEIRALLVTAREQWLHLLHALRGPLNEDARATLCGTSESLLETFDRLTACYEHSLQVILG